MAGTLERRLSDAFLVMNIRQSERTTAEEVRHDSDGAGTTTWRIIQPTNC